MRHNKTEGFVTNDPTANAAENFIVEEIISFGRSMDLEVDSEDVEELVQDHRTELTTEELVHVEINNK